MSHGSLIRDSHPSNFKVRKSRSRRDEGWGSSTISWEFVQHAWSAHIAAHIGKLPISARRSSASSAPSAVQFWKIPRKGEIPGSANCRLMESQSWSRSPPAGTSWWGTRGWAKVSTAEPMDGRVPKNEAGDSLSLGAGARAPGTTIVSYGSGCGRYDGVRNCDECWRYADRLTSAGCEGFEVRSKRTVVRWVRELAPGEVDSSFLFSRISGSTGQEPDSR